MCFRFGSCFGVHVHDDCHAPPPAASKGAPVPPRNAATIHHQPARAGDADRRNMPSAAAAVVATGGHGYAAGAEEKAHGYAASSGAGEASKRHPAAAWIDKVTHGAGIGNGAQYYYYYPTATSTATATSSEHERY